MDQNFLKVMVLRAIIVLTIVTSLAILVAVVKQLVDVEFVGHPRGSSVTRFPSPGNDSLVIGDSNRHLVWFLQISDIHLSKYHDPFRKSDLFTFCTEVVDAVKPSLVVATGDITDSRSKKPLGSSQYEIEWQWYSEVLNKSNVLKKTVWLDVRGNHDAFDVYSKESSNNFYRFYSPQGNHSHSHYKYELRHDTESYTFIGIDACPDPSPKRPFNFVGILKDSDMETLKEMKKVADRNSNATIWFGHYPTSSLARPRNANFRELLDGPYLCGHYHTGIGLVNEMYATHARGGLELEVGDWKDNRKFRIAAYDHGIFSFQDVTLHKWPIILITNPKPALFKMPNLEPLHRISSSSHIRVLVFSPHKIASVEFQINGGPWKRMQASSSQSLFTHNWDPSHYARGLHSISVKAIDEDQNERTVKHEFALDASRPDFPFKAKFAIRLSFQAFMQSVCYGAVAVAVAPLLILRVLHHLQKGKSLKVSARSSRVYRTVFKYYLLSSNNFFFVPLVGIPLYAISGPWFIGEVLTGHWGVCFAWGMFIGRNYLPLGFPYFFATLSIVCFHIPITFCLSHIVYCGYRQSIDNEPSLLRKLLHIRHVFFLIIICCNVFYATIFKHAYGLVSVILGFYNTWSIVIYVILWCRTFTLNSGRFKISGVSEEKSELVRLKSKKEVNKD